MSRSSIPFLPLVLLEQLRERPHLASRLCLTASISYPILQDCRNYGPLNVGLLWAMFTSSLGASTASNQGLGHLGSFLSSQGFPTSIWSPGLLPLQSHGKSLKQESRRHKACASIDRWTQNAQVGCLVAGAWVALPSAFEHPSTLETAMSVSHSAAL